MRPCLEIVRLTSLGWHWNCSYLDSCWPRCQHSHRTCLGSPPLGVEGRVSNPNLFTDSNVRILKAGKYFTQSWTRENKKGLGTFPVARIERESDTREAVSLAFGLLGALVEGHPLHTVSRRLGKPRQQLFLLSLVASSLLAPQFISLLSSRFSSHLYCASSSPMYTHACKF